MKIRFDHPFKLVTLRELAPGDMFRNEDNEGLFLKTFNGNIVVQPLNSDIALGAGCEAGFAKDALVVRIKQIIVYPEVT